MRPALKMRRSVSGTVCLANAGEMTFVCGCMQEAFMEEVAFAMEVTLGRMLGDAERRGPSRGRELHRKVKAKKREGVQV